MKFQDFQEATRERRDPGSGSRAGGRPAQESELAQEKLLGGGQLFQEILEPNAQLRSPLAFLIERRWPGALKSDPPQC